MPAIAGDFEKLKRLTDDIIVRQRDPEILANYHNDRENNYPIFNALAARQRISLPEEYIDPRNCHDKLYMPFLQACETAPKPKSLDCNLPDDCDEVGADSLEIVAESGVSNCGSTVINKCDAKELVSAADKTMANMAQLTASIEKHYEKKVIAFLEQNKEDLTDIESTMNEALEFGGLYNGEWKMTKTEFNTVGEEVFATLEHMSDKLRMVDPVYIMGSLFDKEIIKYNAKNGGGCCDTRDLLMKNNKLFKNSRIFDEVVGAAKIYLVDAAQLYFFNQHWHQSATPVITNPQSTPTDELEMNSYAREWYSNSSNLTWYNNGGNRNVRHDWRLQTVCINRYSYVIKYGIDSKGTWGKNIKGCLDYPFIIGLEICENC